MTPVERGAILEGVREVFSEQLRLSGVEETTHLFDDLHLDSIQQLSLVIGLENRFRVKLEEGDENGLSTVSDIVELISRKHRS